MKNVQAKKQLIKMADKWMKRGMNPGFDEDDYLEEMWSVAFKAYPDMKTAEDSYYVSMSKLNNIVSIAHDELEEHAQHIS
jgi:hypothetical protein